MFVIVIAVVVKNYLKKVGEGFLPVFLVEGKILITLTMSDEELQNLKKLVLSKICHDCLSIFTDDGLQEKKFETGIYHGCPACGKGLLKEYEGYKGELY